MKHVAMEKCNFRVVLEHKPGCGDDPEKLFTADFPAKGRESVVFEIEPNPGEGFRELSRIASGGELARLMLALKVVGQFQPGKCLIFDEIDAGIGGRAAYQIGERLRRLSRQAQVLCVTHLPQVAAFARHHFEVIKKTRSGRTTTSVELLEGDGRIHELARMLSGSEITDTALQHARELCEQVEGRR